MTIDKLNTGSQNAPPATEDNSRSGQHQFGRLLGERNHLSKAMRFHPGYHGRFHNQGRFDQIVNADTSVPSRQEEDRSESDHNDTDTWQNRASLRGRRGGRRGHRSRRFASVQQAANTPGSATNRLFNTLASDSNRTVDAASVNSAYQETGDDRLKLSTTERRNNRLMNRNLRERLGDLLESYRRTFRQGIRYSKLANLFQVISMYDKDILTRETRAENNQGDRPASGSQAGSQTAPAIKPQIIDET